jgi:uncharacterized membrane protein YoaK (UPF0700 family)
VDSSASRLQQRLLLVLSLVAGSTDVISFLGLNGLFTSHITGNLVILAAHAVTGGKAELARMLAVPIFIVVVTLATVIAKVMEAKGIASLRPMLLLQFLLLTGFLIIALAGGPEIADEKIGMLAGMLAVSAMAVQHALVQLSLKGSPATAVMTSNVTRFAIQLGELLRGGDSIEVAEARKQVAHTLSPIVGFTLGCGLGAACEALFGLRSIALPVSLALLAFAMATLMKSNSDGR